MSKTTSGWRLCTCSTLIGTVTARRRTWNFLKGRNVAATPRVDSPLFVQVRQHGRCSTLYNDKLLVLDGTVAIFVSSKQDSVTPTSCRISNWFELIETFLAAVIIAKAPCAWPNNSVFLAEDDSKHDENVKVCFFTSSVARKSGFQQ